MKCDCVTWQRCIAHVQGHSSKAGMLHPAELGQRLDSQTDAVISHQNGEAARLSV